MPCATCQFAHTTEVGQDLSRNVECRKNPPSVFPIVGRTGVQWMSVFPPVTPTTHCHAFEPKVTN